MKLFLVEQTKLLPSSTKWKFASEQEFQRWEKFCGLIRIPENAGSKTSRPAPKGAIGPDAAGRKLNCEVQAAHPAAIPIHLVILNRFVLARTLASISRRWRSESERGAIRFTFPCGAPALSAALAGGNVPHGFFGDVRNF